MKNKKHSEETKIKMSCVHKGKIKSEEHRRNLSISLKGRKSKMKGVPRTQEVKDKISKANSNSNNGMWKGENANYFAKHTWIRNHYGKAKVCEECGKKENIEWANISGLYLRDIIDYRPLCPICHKKYDMDKHIKEILKK